MLERVIQRQTMIKRSTSMIEGMEILFFYGLYQAKRP